MNLRKTSTAALRRRLTNLALALLWLLSGAPAYADGDIDTIREQGAAGRLRAVGGYPFDASAYTVAALPGGEVLVYGGAPLETEGKSADELQSERGRRSSSGLHQEPLAWNPRAKGWKRTEMPPECPNQRLLHTMTALPDGKILVAGGLCDQPRIESGHKAFPPFTALSLWNAATGKWEATSASLSGARMFHAASLLQDGSVLLTGGESEPQWNAPDHQVLATAERYYDGRISQLPPLHVARTRHSATPLMDRSVLVAGGIGKDGKPLDAAEIWDPARQAWREAPPLRTARYKHSATLLADGRVMIAGGIGVDGELLASVEIWDPGLQAWSAGDPLPYPLRSHAAARLSNGDVLMTGGLWNRGTPPGRVLLWDYAGERWRPAGLTAPDMGDKDFPGVALAPRKDGGALIFTHRRILHWLPQVSASSPFAPNGERDLSASAALADGRIMMTGGRLTNLYSQQGLPPMSDAAEIFDPRTGRFTVTGRMRQTRIMHTMLALDDGRAVAAGGWVWQRDKLNVPVANHPEVWNPATGTWNLIKDILFKPQEWVHLGKLRDGRVLFFASDETTAPTPDGQPRYRAWLWDPRSDRVESKPVGAKSHSNAAIAILPYGRVLRVGGKLRGYRPEPSCPPSDRAAGACGEWEDHADATAEIWDSRSGEVTRLAPPPNWTASEGKALTMRNGDAVFVDYLPARFGHNPSLPRAAILRWNARDGSWQSLPQLPSDENWPMLERPDGTLWTPQHYLSPGADTWRDTAPLIQDAPVFFQMPAGEMLALSAQPPYAAILDKKLERWLTLPAKNAPPVWLAAPVAVALADGKVMALGQTERSRHPMTSAYVWNPNGGAWSPSAQPPHPHGRVAQTVLLPSGHVLYTGIGKDNELNCAIWHAEDDRWDTCDSPIMTGTFATAPGLGLLDDGRAVVVADTVTAYVFDEKRMRWVAMKGEWNGEHLAYSTAPSQPLLRIFDDESKQWFDATGAAVRYWEQSAGTRLSPAYSERTAQIREPRLAAPRMLWNATKKEWLYLFNSGDMGQHAQLLPDGCAFSWDPPSVYDPSTGKTVAFPNPGIGVARGQGAMAVLADGSVIVTGVADDITGNGFFHRKVSCAGFEQTADDALMPPIQATQQTSQQVAVAPRIAASSPWWKFLSDRAYEYRWVGLAIVGPLLLYLLLTKLLLPAIRRGAVRILSKRTFALLTQELPSSYARDTRIVVYGLLLLFFLSPLLFRFLAFGPGETPNAGQTPRSPADKRIIHAATSDDCAQKPSACLDPKTGILRSVPALEKRILFYPRARPEIPCRYVGVWTSRRTDGVLLATLKDDGTFVMTKPSGSFRGEGTPYTGYWMAQGEYLVWRHDRVYMPELDVNPILSEDGTHFELLEMDGSRTQFEQVRAVASSTCTR